MHYHCIILETINIDFIIELATLINKCIYDADPSPHQLKLAINLLSDHTHTQTRQLPYPSHVTRARDNYVKYPHCYIHQS